jgi:DNA-binding FadR family transcriptional regulator
MIDEGLQAGDRLPSESELINRFAMAKGTIREAMRILEAQGLVESKTGPGGGTFVRQVSHERARALLSNYFYFRDLSLGDIYQLRKLLEPELVADMAGTLPENVLQKLERNIAEYATPPSSIEQEREYHVMALRFHATLARYSDNPLLGFMIDFMITMLSEITVNRVLYDPPNQSLWERGVAHQSALVKALRSGDSEEARSIMREHMEFAESKMADQEAEVLKRFIDETTRS